MDDNDELDRILANTNLDEFELAESLRALLDGSSLEEPGIRSAPTMCTNSMPGLPPRKIS